MDGSILGFQSTNALDDHPYATTLSDKLTGQFALTQRVMEDAWRVRHASYVAQGYLDPIDGGMFTDEFDDPKHSMTAVIYVDQEPIGSVRISRHDPDLAAKGIITMPTFAVFPDVIPEFLERHGQPGNPATASELNRIVCLPAYRSDLRVISGLFRMAKYISLFCQTDVTFASARPNHLAIYRRIGFNLAAPARPYVKLKFETALLAAIYPHYQEIQSRFPALATASRSDCWYPQLINGEQVPVFPNGLSPWRESKPSSATAQAA